MLHKSKFESSAEPSQVNASWDFSAFDSQTSSSGARPNSVQGARGSTHEQALATNQAPSSSPLKRQRPDLIEPEKLESLLELLRSDEFAGKIDVKHHSHYFKPPETEIQLNNNRDNAGSSNRVYHQSLTQLYEARKDYFKEALAGEERPTKCSRSHASLGS